MVRLSAVEARVLGVLIEKEINTPEYYPLSLNATVNACNQKSSREPVMELAEADVRSALFELEQMGLVRALVETRATKFEHRVRDVLNLRRDEVAVLCLLLLRGPQTAAELRARAERMYAFDDTAAVLSVLERMAAHPEPGQETGPAARPDARPAQHREPLTQLLQRQPGSREARWMHLLCGPVSETEAPAESAPAPAGGALRDGLTRRVTALEELAQAAEARLRALEERLQVTEERLQTAEEGLRALEGALVNPEP